MHKSRFNLILLCLFALLLFAAALPALAQDVTPAATAEAPVVTAPIIQMPAENTSSVWMIIFFGLLVFFTVDKLVQGRITQAASQLLPADILSQISKVRDEAFQQGLQYGLNSAARTPNPLDDMFWLTTIQAAGYEAIKQDDGTYIVRKKEQPPETGERVPVKEAVV